MTNAEYEARIQELEDKIRDKDREIDDMKKLAEAYNHLSDLFNQELIEADRTLKAQEIIQNMMREEKIQAEETIHAHEHLEEFNVIEKIEVEKILEAHEQVTNLSIQELIHKDEVLRKILDVNKSLSAILDTDILLHKILKSIGWGCI